MSKNKNFLSKLVAGFVSIVLMSFVSMGAVFAADAPPSIDFSFDDDDDDAPPSLGSSPSSTTKPKPPVPPPPKPSTTVTTTTPKKVTKTGPGLLYPILLGVGSLYYFRKRREV